MRNAALIALTICLGHAAAAHAASGNAEAGRQLVMRSCSSCHATEFLSHGDGQCTPVLGCGKDQQGKAGMDTRLADVATSAHAEHLPVASADRRHRRLSWQSAKQLVAALGKTKCELQPSRGSAVPMGTSKRVESDDDR